MRQISLLLVVVLLSGCSLLPVRPDNQFSYFDLGSPSANDNRRVNVEILPIATSGPYSEEMVFRDSPNSLLFDQHNLWVESPAKILQRYFVLYFGNVSSNMKTPVLLGKKYVVHLNLLRFECNIPGKKAVMTLDVVLQDAASGKTLYDSVINEEIPVNKLTALAFAQSLSVATGKIAAELYEKINEIEKSKSG